MRRTDPRHSFAPGAQCLELELCLDDGSPWRLTMSAGIERFIGYYPRIDGIGSDGPLLRFRTVSPA